MTDKYADLPPHPLFTGLTIALSREALESAPKRWGVDLEKSDEKRRSFAKRVAALRAQEARKEMAAPAQDEPSAEEKSPAEKESPADHEPSADDEPPPGSEPPPNPLDVPALSTFAGYLGDAIKYADRDWRVLYLDTKLSSWLLVEEEAILFHERMHDRTAAYGMRDVIWLNAEETVGRGIGPQSGEARFLRGSFTSAGDVTAAVTGGTFDAATGIFCEAQTPGCCGWPTHH